MSLAYLPFSVPASYAVVPPLPPLLVEPCPETKLELATYSSLADLRATILSLESGLESEPEEVVLILDARFAGHLPSLLARANPGGRLVIVPLSGRTPHDVGTCACH